jgi:hypothetical protein
MLGKAVTRIASTLAATLLFVMISVASGHAQATTGKIQGRVTSSTGQPIASAQVTVDGTRLGNITNDEGFYFINDVPAGLQTVRAQSIGYRTVALTEQRILAGQTFTFNFQLEAAAVELEALIVAGERNPLVPRDQVGSRSIVTGETIDRLPLDNSNSIITLQPGVVSTNTGFSIRGSRENEHAVYVDGVPVRNLRTGEAQAIEIGTNALAQVDVQTGGLNARFGNAQSGVVNYVTRTGGSTLGGSVTFYTDRLAPEGIRGGFSRGEYTLGGPVPFINNLSFFTSSTLEGRKYAGAWQNNPYPVFIPVGVDTTFTLARTGQIAGATDSVRVVVPNYVEWDNGATLPTSTSDEINWNARLRYDLPRGSNLDVTYYYNRNQSLTRGSNNIMNPDAWSASRSTRNMVTAGGRFLLAQTSERALSLDIRASYQNDWGQSGTADNGWLENNLFPAFGFRTSNVKFLMDPSEYPVTEEMVLAIRSGVLPARILSIMPGRSDLITRQGVAGVSQALRLNPYAMRTSWSVSGLGNASQAYNSENRLYMTASADWQMNRFNRLNFGGDITKADTKTMSVPLYDGTPSASLYEPTTGGLFATNRLDIGDVVLEGGVRMDYYDPNGAFPRVPGFVQNVPDSLRADYYRLRPGDEPWNERLAQVQDCGGAETADRRRNATTGEIVCKNNFVQAQSRTTFSPRIAVSFPVTVTSTFRLSYGQNVQPTNLTRMFSSNFSDLAGGAANTNTTFGRDVEMPRTIMFEAGYRQLFGGKTVVDASAYSRTTRNSLTYRKVSYDNPTTGSVLFLNVLMNADYSLTRGLDLNIRRQLSAIADVTVNYSFLDARGTGSDPFSYTGLILRRNSNLSVLTGNPVDPPELLMTLDQSRAHTVNGILALAFDSEAMEDSRIGNAILSDLGIFATMNLGSGLPYTRLINSGNGQTGPPTRAGQGAQTAEQLNASRTPMEKQFDLRVTKGFQVLGRGAQLFVDARNPLNFENTPSVYMETGTTENEAYVTSALRGQVLTQAGGTAIRDITISTIAENDLNKYMMRKAEAQWGNGDGIFSVEEQYAAWGQYWQYFNGSFRLRNSQQSLRLGFQVMF